MINKHMPQVTNIKRFRRKLHKMGLRSIYGALAFGIIIISVLILTEIIIIMRKFKLDDVIQLGLLQPLCAAIIASAITIGTWIAKGGFANEQRKGVRSASSSAIAIKLWALCFTLFISAMLASSFLARSQRDVAVAHAQAPGSELTANGSVPAAKTPSKVNK